MIGWLGLLLLADVAVQAPPECVTASAIEAAVGELDVVERVAVSVADAAVIGTRSPTLLVTIHIELLRALPLERRLTIAPLECADLPDLVALLVREQRTAPFAEPPALPPPEPRLRPHADAARAPSGYSPCGPGCAAGTWLSVALGPIALLSFPLHPDGPIGARVLSDAMLDLSKDTALLVGVDVAVVPNRGHVVGQLGPVWRRRGLGVDGSLRATLGAGFVGYESGRSSVALVPGVGARAQFDWWFIDTSALVQVTTNTLPAPGIALSVGLTR